MQATHPFLAYIVPVVSEGVPTHPIVIPPAPGQPPGIWGGGNEPFPTPPIAGVPGAPGYRPPGTWGGAGEGFPTPPIVIPPDKPGIWPPQNPAHPAHPIVLPPENLPPGIDPPPGGETGSPEHPINLPPSAVTSTHGFWALTFFKEMGGWLWAWVPVDVAKPAAAGKK